MEQIYKQSFNGVNSQLATNNRIDDSLSGTTGITVIVKGDVLYVGNVGDSRAIIASDVGGSITFSPLSNDQTPYRKDERDRLKARGAKVMSLDQIEGSEPMHERWGEDGVQGEDPPRVWDATLEKPGCGFTRSIGDSIGEQIGVISNPEVLEWKLSPADKFVVIGSDGLFEFLHSQVVVELLNKVMQTEGDMVTAVKYVISEAFRLWVSHDDRTDDITAICIQFDSFQPKLTASPANSKRSAPDSSAVNNKELNKRLKASLPKEKVDDIHEKWTKFAIQQTKFDFAKNNFPKTPAELSSIEYTLSICQFFKGFTSEQLKNLTSVLRRRQVIADQMLFEEGGEVDGLYIIESGEFAAFKYDDNGVEHRVFTYPLNTIIGELSLIFNTPSDVKVLTIKEGKLWTVSKAAFRAIVTNNQTYLGTTGLNNVVSILSN